MLLQFSNAPVHLRCGNFSLVDVYRRTLADNFFRQLILDPLIRIFSKMLIPRDFRL